MMQIVMMMNDGDDVDNCCDDNVVVVVMLKIAMATKKNVANFEEWMIKKRR